MTFSEQYSELEGRFQEQVVRDNKDLGIDSSYVHNLIPPGPVDYVLIAMEPSTGGPVKDTAQSSQIRRNFTLSVEDFILHYCIREYLCLNDETYHLTDLAKGGMTIKSADEQRQARYDRWYPLLEKELRLLNKPSETRLIAIGKGVATFLSRKIPRTRVERVLHYSRNAAGHRHKAIQPWREHFPEFSQTVDKNAFEESIKDVLTDADMDSYIGHRPAGDDQLTESRKKLMFYYKNRFGEIQKSSDSILKL